MNGLRIVVADDELEMRDYLRETLENLGHKVTGVAGTGAELVAVCQRERPDLVVSDIRMPDMDGIAAADRICEAGPIPIILVSAHHDPETIERAASNHILGYLVKPIRKEHLPPAIAVARHRFDQFQALRKEASDLRQALEDRKIIERAKGLLMKKGRLDEAEAFQRLQRMARTNQKKLVEMATLYLSIEEMAYAPAEVRPHSPH